MGQHPLFDGLVRWDVEGSDVTLHLTDEAQAKRIAEWLLSMQQPHADAAEDRE